MDETLGEIVGEILPEGLFVEGFWALAVFGCAVFGCAVFGLAREALEREALAARVLEILGAVVLALGLGFWLWGLGF